MTPEKFMARAIEIGRAGLRTKDARPFAAVVVRQGKIVGEGTYNDFGVRRWFERPRSVFNGRTARQLLSRRWAPSDEPARSVLAAAESLQDLGAT